MRAGRRRCSKLGNVACCSLFCNIWMSSAMRSAGVASGSSPHFVQYHRGRNPAVVPMRRGFVVTEEIRAHLRHGRVGMDWFPCISPFHPLPSRELQCTQTDCLCALGWRCFRSGLQVVADCVDAMRNLQRVSSTQLVVRIVVGLCVTLPMQRSCLLSVVFVA